MIFRAGIGVALTLVVLSTAVSQAWALLSHRAVYDLSEGRLDSGSDVAAVSGRLVVEAIEECDGYILNQRIVTRTVGASGQETLSDYRLALWESRKGEYLRFNASSLVDGSLVHQDLGKANLPVGGGAGRAMFTSPEGLEFDLPANTVFPVAHNMLVLRSARAGRSSVSAEIFDGSSDGRYDVFTAIGRRHVESDEARRGQKLLDDLPFWHVRMGYFPSGSRAEQPEFEIGYNLFDNGVAGDLVLDYGNFVIAGELRRLEPLPTPVCTE